MGKRKEIEGCDVSDRELGFKQNCMHAYVIEAGETFPFVNPYKFDHQALKAMLDTLAKRALIQVGVERVEDASEDDFVSASHYICNGGYVDMENTFRGEAQRHGVPFEFDRIHPLICQKLDWLLKVHAA